MAEKVYKVFNKKEGGFNKAGFDNTGKIGKIWSARSIKCHLALYRNWRDKSKLAKEVDDLEVVEYEMVEVRRIPVKEFLGIS